jgi:hypothetical protein
MHASRFEVNPFVTKPIDPRTASQQVPVFLPACSQFIVEYAGDFVSQNPNGSIDATAPSNGLSPDGTIDYYCELNAAGDVISKRTQWFGYPRSITGAATVSASNGDVTLLGDFVHYISGAGARPVTTSPYTNYALLDAVNPTFARFERIGNAGTGSAAKTARDTFPLLDNRTTMPTVAEPFFAAWGPDDTNRPKMYRITLTIDRPEMAGRTPDGATFEYVFNAP